jgi:hypothetical protein
LDILPFFQVTRPWDIVWHHGVNSWEKLRRCCAAPFSMMVEGDIAYSKTHKQLIMAHPPDTESDLTLKEWLAYIVKMHKGAKLDFKEAALIPESLELVKTLVKDIPIVLNADTIQGPHGEKPSCTTQHFIAQCSPLGSDVLLSIGWTTEDPPVGAYTPSMITQMLEECAGFSGPITFPVRACFLQSSWEQIQPLFWAPQHSITIWNALTEDLPPALLTWIKETIDPQRAFYDLTGPDGLPLRL